MTRRTALFAAFGDAIRADGSLVAALTYGSFAAGEGDEFSDIEFWLFFDSPGTDPEAWISRVERPIHIVRNEFGTDVAFFAGGVRGEFHLVTGAELESVRTWPARGADVEKMVLVDRDGTLRAALESLPLAPVLPSAAEVCGRFANWVLLAHHVSCRGEYLRARDAMGHVERHLLWMARLLTGATQHWLTPSRAAETDLPASVLKRLDGEIGRAHV